MIIICMPICLYGTLIWSLAEEDLHEGIPIDTPRIKRLSEKVGSVTTAIVAVLQALPCG